MAELAGSHPESGAPVRLAVAPEGRHDGPDHRLVLLRLTAPGLDARAGAEMRELARLGRALRRRAREGEPFAGLTLGWAVTWRGEAAAGGCRVTLLYEAAEGQAPDAYPLVAEAAAVEAFVEALEHQVTALR